MTLETFNALAREDALRAVRPCVGIDRWVVEVVDSRPYASVNEVLAFARGAAPGWSLGELDAALARHPRIGERAAGKSKEESMSRSEQSGVDATDRAVIEALESGNRAYEEKFGRVFLIRAAGRSAAEILEALTERLQNSEEDELVIVAEQLREIAVLRLEGILDK